MSENSPPQNLSCTQIRKIQSAMSHLREGYSVSHDSKQRQRQSKVSSNDVNGQTEVFYPKNAQDQLYTTPTGTLPKKHTLIWVSRGGENAALVFSTWLYICKQYFSKHQMIISSGEESYLILNSLSSGEDYVSLLMFSKYPNKFPKVKDISVSNPSSILQDTISLSSLCLRCLEEENLATLHWCMVLTSAHSSGKRY